MIVRMSVTTRSLSSKAPGKVAVRCRRRDLLRVPGRREPWLLSRCRRTASVDQPGGQPGRHKTERGAGCE